MIELNVHNLPIIDLIDLFDILTPAEKIIAAKRIMGNPDQDATIEIDNKLQELRSIANDKPE